MKQKIVLFIFAGFLAILLSSNAGGYGAQNGGDGTGASGSPGCGCHGSTSGIGTTVALDSAGVPVTSYRGGMSYTVKISATNTTAHTLPDFGFQLATVLNNGAGTGTAAQAGTWGTALPANVQNTTAANWGGTFDLIEQSNRITATSGTGASGTTYVESIPWTAPAAGTGTIKIYGVVNAVNGNGSSSGDYNQVANAVTITEAVAVAAVASVHIAQTTGTNPACAGASVTFTATPTNGGTAPVYQWKVNGTNAGTNSATFTTTTLTTGAIVTCVMTSNLGGVTGSPATSNSITMTINPSVVPAVSITTPTTTVCAGASVTFTATPTNGGTPSYQWKVNGTNVGTNSATYTTTTLTTGQIVSCVMTSTASCAVPATGTSNSITMTVNPSVVPSVSITTPTTTICSGTSVTFTATPTNGGTTPSYQWKVNGTNVGTNSASYTTTTLTNGQIVTCTMTSNASCAVPATATSNSVTMTISSAVAPTVSITTPTTSICPNSSVTFTATPTNGGTTPSYQWKVNGTNVGTNSATYTTTTLTNGQIVTCILTSSSSCASPSTATSNAVTITVNSNVVPAVSIATANMTVCSGASVTFTATPTNGGTTPSYQWKVNGANVGTNSATYTTTTLTTGQIVSCVMTSGSACASPSTATSNSLTMTVNPSVAPSVSITTATTTVCSGTPVTFTATPTNGGTAPSYQWQVNGTNAGTNSATFTTSTLTNGQTVKCVMTSNASCAVPASATSNVITITISSAVAPTVNISTPSSSVCPGSSVTFTATPASGGTTPSYQWKVNGTNVGTNSPTYTTTTLTSGQIVSCVMTSSSSCASPSTATSNSITMTVATQTPTITINSTATTICSGAADTFTAQITNGGTSPVFQWKVNGVNAGTNSSRFISSTLASGSAITCTLTSSLACASPSSATSNSITVNIGSSVVPTISISTPRDTICPGGSATFTATGTNLGAATYQWILNGSGVTSNSPTYTAASLSNGNTISCVVTSSLSCASPRQATSNTITMFVPAGPAITITPSGTVTLCAGDSLQLTASGASAYQWSNSATGSSIWVNATGTYDVAGSNGTCFYPATAPAVVVVHTPVVPTLSQNHNVITATASASYQWVFNGTPMAGDTFQTLTIHQSGNYYVITRDANGCYAKSIQYLFSYVNGVGTIGNDLGVKLYPIPNQGSFMVESSGLTDADISIFDIYGQKVYQQKLTSDHTQISNIGLSSAIYFVTISDQGRSETIKMQITKE